MASRTFPVMDTEMLPNQKVVLDEETRQALLKLMEECETNAETPEELASRWLRGSREARLRMLQSASQAK
jgi:hypothetical protein